MRDKHASTLWLNFYRLDADANIYDSEMRSKLSKESQKMDLSSTRRNKDAASDVSLLRPEELLRRSPILLSAYYS